jgi:hypothetical protein
MQESKVEKIICISKYSRRLRRAEGGGRRGGRRRVWVEAVAGGSSRLKMVGRMD